MIQLIILSVEEAVVVTMITKVSTSIYIESNAVDLPTMSTRLS